MEKVTDKINKLNTVKHELAELEVEIIATDTERIEKDESPMGRGYYQRGYKP